MIVKNILLLVSLALACVGATRAQSLATSDLNGDGFGDLILQTRTGGIYYLEFMSNTVSKGGRFVLDGQDLRPWHIAATADLNGDGKPELIARSGGEHLVGALSNGAVVATIDLFRTPADLAPWGVVAAGDFDGDGYSDLLFRKGNSGVYAVVLQQHNMWTAMNYFGGAAIDISPFRIIAAADTDGNGRSELIVREGNTGIYGIVKVNGWAIQSAMYLTGARIDIRPWDFRAASDLNGDGRDELIFVDAHSGRHGVAYMNGFIIENHAEIFAGDTNIVHWHVIGPR